MDQNQTSLVIGERVQTLDPRPVGPATIPLDALTRHVCILGTTGSGKSTCAAVLALELNRLNMPTVILDRTGEYVEFLAAVSPGSSRRARTWSSPPSTREGHTPTSTSRSGYLCLITSAT